MSETTSNHGNSQYRVGRAKKGSALIINNRQFSPHLQLPPRTFSDTDIASLYVNINKLGLDVEMYENQTGSAIEQLLARAAARNHSSADCFMVVLLSYGEQGVIYGTDRPVQVDQLIAFFRGAPCRSLAGKPKIFIVQACDPTLYALYGQQRLQAPQEEECDGGSHSGSGRKKRHKIPSEADFLIAWSSIPGALPWRDPHKNGSTFIEALCAELTRLKDDHSIEIVKLLTRVNRRVAYDLEKNSPLIFQHSGSKLPIILNMLTKELYLT